MTTNPPAGVADVSIVEFMNGAPCGFISSQPDGTILYINDTMVAWVGQDRDALVGGTRLQDLLTVPGRIFYETHIAPMLRLQGSVHEIACQLKRAGREPLNVFMNSDLKTGPGDQPLLINTIIFEATERMQYELELRRARNEALQLAAIVTSSTDAIISVGFDGLVKTWNPAAMRLFGYAEAEAVGRSVDELIIPEGGIGARRDAYEEIRAGNNKHVSETVRRCKDGRLVPVQIDASPVLDTDGRVSSVSVIFRDISRYKQGERQLRDSERKFKATFDNAAIGMAQVAPDGSWLNVNERLCQIVGYTAEELLSGAFQDITHPDDLAADLANVQRMLDGQCDSYSMEKRYICKDGSARWVNLTVGCERKADGSIDYFISAVEDIAARKKAEDHNALLMREVNHRAKNLLAVVQAVARQTARSHNPATFVDRLTRRIASLTASHDLLVKDQWQGVDLLELVEGQLAHFGSLFGGRVSFDGPTLRLGGDAAQAIGMALHELATNAGKYGALFNAEGCVRISWTVSDAPDCAFEMAWLEENGPEVVAPGKPGFGQTVIVKMAERAVGGHAELAYLRSGVKWTLTAAADRILEGHRND